MIKRNRTFLLYYTCKMQLLCYKRTYVQKKTHTVTTYGLPEKV